MTASLRASRAATAVALLGLAIVVGVLLAHRLHWQPPESIGMENYDLLNHFHPTATFVHDQLGRGELPLWNPYQLAGMPFLGLHVTAALYPPNVLLYSVFPPAAALEAHFAVHLVLAGFFAWLLARRLGLELPASCTAAFGYMLCAPIVAGLYNTPYLSTHAWLPALLWSLHGLVQERRLRWVPAFAASAALPFLGGHAQAFVYEMQVAFAWGGFLLFSVCPAGVRWKAVGLAILGGMLALALVAPQLLPALEYTALANRSYDGHRFLQSAFAAFRPEVVARGLIGGEGYGVGLYRWIVTVPFFTVPLALLGVLRRPTRGAWLFFGATAVIVGLLLLGGRGPLFRLYFELPLGSLFRGPQRMAFVYVFSLVFCAAIGTQACVDWIRARGVDPRWASLAGGALAAAFAGLFYANTALRSAHPATLPPRLGAPAEVVDYLHGQRFRQRFFVVQPKGPPAFELTRKAGMMNGLAAVPDYEPTVPRDYARFFGPRAPGVWHGTLMLAAEAGRPLPELSRLLDLMSVRYFVQLGAEMGLPERLTAVGGRRVVNGLPLVERPGALPRAYTVRRVHTVDDFESAMQRVLTPSFRPDREAVVFGEGAGAVGRPPARPGRGAREARITALDLDHVRVEAACDARCLLVLTDLRFPGWEATVDGHPREILTANALFRGVWLEPGEHRVDFRFVPRSFTAGLRVAGLGLLATGVVGLFSMRQRARSRPAPA